MDKFEELALKEKNISLLDNYLASCDLNYILRYNVFTMSFPPPEGCSDDQIINIAVSGKNIISSNATGVYLSVCEDEEMLRALNFINNRIIGFGRFSINSRNEVVYDYGINLYNRQLNKNDCEVILGVVIKVLKSLVRPLYDIANGRITADRFISDNS